ncbi:MAG: helix-turn-helix transcriptional regulator [Flavobacteriales bacterium]|nr:helix-turn-helix transcriptional regulator [Flavobacteriales bacterium]
MITHDMPNMLYRINNSTMDSVNLDHVRSHLKQFQINRIKEVLDQKGVSQAWVARRMSKTCNTLNGWCANKCQPHLVDLFILAALLDCHIRDLISEDDPRQVIKAGQIGNA